MAAREEAIRNDYESWHAAIKARDAEAMAALCADDAVLETASVLPLWPEYGSGIVTGRAEIRRFFKENLELNPDVSAEWHRTDTYSTNGRILMWEYPRVTPTGEQAGIVKSMDIDDIGPARLPISPT